MKTPNLILVSLGLFMISLLTVGCTESFADRCRREAREFTDKQCPHSVDAMTDLDSMVYVDEPQGFAYYYSLHGEADADSLITDDVIEEFHTRLCKNLRNDISMKPYKERQFTFSYIYISKSTGKKMVDIELTPEDY
ncbi:MAG: hypothetical protein K6F94_01335 [Bacteroidaceae bacterium]|nr:hypothetical protein [Bacteroidaceae bacterium]